MDPMRQDKTAGSHRSIRFSTFPSGRTLRPSPTSPTDCNRALRDRTTVACKFFIDRSESNEFATFTDSGSVSRPINRDEAFVTTVYPQNDCFEMREVFDVFLAFEELKMQIFSAWCSGEPQVPMCLSASRLRHSRPARRRYGVG
jgi:hypothetical protein